MNVLCGSKSLKLNRYHVFFSSEPRPPEFIVPLKTVMAIENKSAQFTCEVIGTPKPEITWYKGLREIFNHTKYSMTQEGDTYTLTIREVYGEDADEYACRAVNKGGSRTSRAELIIKSMYLSIAVYHQSSSLCLICTL